MKAVITGVGVTLGIGHGREGLAGLWSGEVPEETLVGRPRGKRYSERYDRFQSMDTYSRLAFVSADHALDEAGLLEEVDLRDPMGVVFGTRYGCHEANLQFDQFRYEEEGLKNASPLAFKGTVDNAPAGWVSVAFGLRGPNLTLVSGRAAAAQSMAQALVLLTEESAPGLLVGGVERSTPFVRALLPEGDPSQAEGAGVVVLESLAAARDRGAEALIQVVDVFAGDDPVNGLERNGIELADLGLLLADPTGPPMSEELRDQTFVQSCATVGDLHGAWGGVALALAVENVERWSPRGDYALVQACDEAGLPAQWILLQIP